MKIHHFCFILVICFAAPRVGHSGELSCTGTAEKDGCATGSASTGEVGQDAAIRAESSSTVCQLMESAAGAHDVPFDFFARVIWQESRFKANAIGPVTRSGKQAQGIAQFMPMTAAERRVLDPFDPSQALPKAAEFLRQLRGEFGNLGLAAAAYNAGPQRVRDWLAGRRSLPRETQAYVQIVTGRNVQEWKAPGTEYLPLLSRLETPCLDPAGLAMSSPKAPASGTESQKPAPVLTTKMPLEWGVQLIGDQSEAKALASFTQLKRAHVAILGLTSRSCCTMADGIGCVWPRQRVRPPNHCARDCAPSAYPAWSSGIELKRAGGGAVK